MKSPGVMIRVWLTPVAFQRLKTLKERLGAATYNEVIRQALYELDLKSGRDGINMANTGYDRID